MKIDFTRYNLQTQREWDAYTSGFKWGLQRGLMFGLLLGVFLVTGVLMFYIGVKW
jgi:hypothetical protein